MIQVFRFSSCQEGRTCFKTSRLQLRRVQLCFRHTKGIAAQEEEFNRKDAYKGQQSEGKWMSGDIDG